MWQKIREIIQKEHIDTFDGAKPRFLNRGKKRRSVSTLSIPRALDRGVEWVDFVHVSISTNLRIYQRFWWRW
jgi:hypothetical protein